ncbi:hypothetical protein BRARA_I01358 [Brassica rapa]|uniref:Uncharacterized protein n=1 Tax=Brassica campestris TaxID=3711 RepID=A0A397XYP8_BRACM|nr:hypothetical protein BRARA_I01358 [Brassica rapa]
MLNLIVNDVYPHNFGHRPHQCLDFLEMRQLHLPKSTWEWVCSLAPPLLTSCVISYLTAL